MTRPQRDAVQAGSGDVWLTCDHGDTRLDPHATATLSRMCGIGGILLTRDHADASRALHERLRAGLTQLHHRGPDGEGLLVEGPCGLSHTRLSIVDLTGGAQPMSLRDEHGRIALTVTFNGEIYNHRELRRQLERAGHRFHSDHADTEVLLHGHRAWGEELPKHLEGMFAYALWDTASQRLTLARDRTGKKPLYYYVRTGEFVFGSLVATVMAALPRDERPGVDEEALRHYLQLGYTAEPSLFQGIVELPPGHLLHVDRTDTIAPPRRYWHPPDVSRSVTTTGVLAATEEVLGDAVERRLHADVPIGCFLSGGIDSSLVSALAQQRLIQRGDPPLRTFSVRMPISSFDESIHARQVADHLGTQHTELEAGHDTDAMADLARLVALSGEPTADSSILPTHWISRAARQHVKVVLSGDGGDELFGGYDRYRAMRLLARHRWWIARLPGARFASRPGRSRLSRLGRLIAAARPRDPARQYLRMIHLFTTEQLRAMGAPAARDDDPMPPAPGWVDEESPDQAAMRWDFGHYLPFDLLRKVDRASMAVALEVRCPLLDTQVIELACHLPSAVLTPGGRPKALLRQLAARRLPESITQRPKRGFAIPVGQWIAGDWRDRVREHLLDGPLPDLGLRRDTIEAMLNEHLTNRCDHTHRLFALLTLSMWMTWRRQPGVTVPMSANEGVS